MKRLNRLGELTVVSNPAHQLSCHSSRQVGKIDSFFAPVRKNLFSSSSSSSSAGTGPQNENSSSVHNCFCIVDDDYEGDDTTSFPTFSQQKQKDLMPRHSSVTEPTTTSFISKDEHQLNKTPPKVLDCDDDILLGLDSIPTVEEEEKREEELARKRTLEKNEDDALGFTPKKKLCRLRRTSSLEKEGFQTFYNDWKKRSSSKNSLEARHDIEAKAKDPFAFLDDCVFDDHSNTYDEFNDYDDDSNKNSSDTKGRKRLRKKSDIISNSNSSIVISDGSDDGCGSSSNSFGDIITLDSPKAEDDSDEIIVENSNSNSNSNSNNNKAEQVTVTEEVEAEVVEDDEKDEEEDTIEGILSMCENCSTKLFNFIEKYRKPKAGPTPMIAASQCSSQLPAASTAAAQDGQPEMQPSILRGELKNYQLVGMNWLYLIHRFDMNGILADEMGLGKTVQTIAFLSLLYEKGIGGPHIILVPASTLENWERELQAWCPTLKVLVYYGTLKERAAIQSSVRPSRDLQCGKPISKLDYNVVLTTYTMACSKYDRPFFMKSNFEYMIIDEAQNIKNAKSMRFEKLLRIPSQRRILLTGTPLQNNLNELWALIYFLMPDIISRSTLRKHAFVKGNEDRSIERMKKILAPFILRRLKSQILTEMVSKTHTVVECDMPEAQCKLYADMLLSSKSQWSKMVSKKDGPDPTTNGSSDEDSNSEDDCIIVGDDASSHKPDSSDDDDDDSDNETAMTSKKKEAGSSSYAHIVSNIVMQLRKMANHPMLCRSFYTDKTIEKIAASIASHPSGDDMRFSGMNASMIHQALNEWSDFDVHSLCCGKPFLHEHRLLVDDLFCSAKLSKLREMLLGPLSTKKVLVFSQMTRVLDILEIALKYDGISFLRLDGSTPVSERQTLVDAFNAKQGAYVFLLSTGAAGLGINLTSADTVVFYDISFNPQVDRQAEDRCHRIGQKNPVTIYKLIAKDTIDANMLRLAADKQLLHDKVFEEGKYDAQSQKLTFSKKRWMTEILSSMFVTKN